MTRNPYANTDLLIGALKICSIRKDHVIGAFDDLAAVAAGKGVVLK